MDDISLVFGAGRLQINGIFAGVVDSFKTRPCCCLFIHSSVGVWTLAIGYSLHVQSVRNGYLFVSRPTFVLFLDFRFLLLKIKTTDNTKQINENAHARCSRAAAGLAGIIPAIRQGDRRQQRKCIWMYECTCRIGRYRCAVCM